MNMCRMSLQCSPVFLSITGSIGICRSGVVGQAGSSARGVLINFLHQHYM